MFSSICVLPRVHHLGLPTVTLLFSKRLISMQSRFHINFYGISTAKDLVACYNLCFGEEERTRSSSARESHPPRAAAMAAKLVMCRSWLRPRQAWVRYMTEVDASRGVGPTKGPENDPSTRGATPDDSRADHVHMFEPKEITKKKVAEAQEEPAGLQGSKLMPGFDAPVNKDAKPQSTTVDQNQ